MPGAMAGHLAPARRAAFCRRAGAGPGGRRAPGLDRHPTGLRADVGPRQAIVGAGRVRAPGGLVGSGRGLRGEARTRRKGLATLKGGTILNKTAQLIIVDAQDQGPGAGLYVIDCPYSYTATTAPAETIAELGDDRL